MRAAAQTALVHRSAPMDPDVAAALQKLCLAYGLAVDVEHFYAAGDLFTDDAVWDGSEFGYGRHVGREAIVGALMRHTDEQTVMMAQSVAPLAWMCGADAAAGLSYFTALSTSAAPTRGACGVFEDEYVQEQSDGVWRFRSRKLRLRLTTS